MGEGPLQLQRANPQDLRRTPPYDAGEDSGVDGLFEAGRYPPSPSSTSGNERPLPSDSEISQYTNDFSRAHPDVQQPIQQVLILHYVHQNLKQQFQREMHALERKYNARYQEIYARRFKVTNTSPTQGPVGKGIPNFWLKAMRNNPTINGIIEKTDREALKYLQNIRLECLSSPGFNILFDFEENPFFSNRTLKKTFMYKREDDHYAQDMVFGSASKEIIFWKPRRNLTERMVKNNKGVISKISVDSFFDFFDSPDEDEDSDSDSDSESDAEDVAYREWALENDFNLGEEFKEKLIPYALQWYTGEASLYESEDENASDSTEEESDGEEESDDDDEDDGEKIEHGDTDSSEESEESDEDEDEEDEL